LEGVVSKKISVTPKDVALLYQLHRENQLTLASEFQRDNVWPPVAKAYLIDTILANRPIPPLFFQRTVSAQTGRTVYSVIDGQQRLRAIFEFMENKFLLSESKNTPYHKKRFNDLTEDQKREILNYDLTIEELSGYTDPDIVDMFDRMNRYVVRLSRQELRHAKEKGAFRDFVERLAKLDFWTDERVFSDAQRRRMRVQEFVAELTILLVEGPQDKKKAIDLYYGEYRDSFPNASFVESRLKQYLQWIRTVFPDLRTHRYRKPVDLYGLIGAIDEVSAKSKKLRALNPQAARNVLLQFENQTHAKEASGDAAKYVLAASRQTDNIGPRTSRIQVLGSILGNL
jgi:Protein of unknown function DUF262